MMFRIQHIEAVFERSWWLVEAESEGDALDRFHDGNAKLDEGTPFEIVGGVEFIDSEIEGVEEVK